MPTTFFPGIDGGSWRLLNALNLPAFDRLTANAITGTLRSTFPPITFFSWKCYLMGKNPGQLGIFGFSDFECEHRTNKGNDASNFDSAEIWDYPSSAGKRVDVVNMPTTHPPHKHNTVMLAGPNAGENDYITLAFKSGGEKAVCAAIGGNVRSVLDITLEICDVAPMLLHVAGHAVPTDVSSHVCSVVLSSSDEERDVSTREPTNPRQTTDNHPQMTSNGK